MSGDGLPGLFKGGVVTLGEKIDLLVLRKKILDLKGIKVDPYKDLPLLEALDKTLDAAFILLLLIEEKGETE